MPILEWDKSFELGVAQFDEHHRQLVSLLNETYDNFTSGANYETLGAVLDKLIDYATYHFAAEEYWMDLNKYDGLQQQREEHNKFSRRVAEIQKDFHKGKAHLSIEVLTFLRNWLTDHILKIDAEYGRFAAQFPPVQS
jgi:hemerythrin